MEKVDTRNKRMIVLPEGCFCGNCMECIYADRSDWNGDRVYCRCQKGWTHGYNRPEDRNGCIWFEARYESDGPVVKEQIGHQDQCGTMNSPDLLFKSCKVRLALGKAALE